MECLGWGIPWVWSVLDVESIGYVECLGCGSIVNAGSDVGVEVQVF